MSRPHIDPNLHPTSPYLVVEWHSVMLGKIQARRSWPLLSSHLLYELRACPQCGQPVIRWRRLDEIKARVIRMAHRAANYNATLAASRLRVDRKRISDVRPQKGKPRPGGAR